MDIPKYTYSELAELKERQEQNQRRKDKMIKEILEGNPTFREMQSRVRGHFEQLLKYRADNLYWIFLSANVSLKVKRVLDSTEKLKAPNQENFDQTVQVIDYRDIETIFSEFDTSSLMSLLSPHLHSDNKNTAIGYDVCNNLLDWKDPKHKLTFTVNLLFLIMSLIYFSDRSGAFGHRLTNIDFSPATDLISGGALLMETLLFALGLYVIYSKYKYHPEQNIFNLLEGKAKHAPEMVKLLPKLQKAAGFLQESSQSKRDDAQLRETVAEVAEALVELEEFLCTEKVTPKIVDLGAYRGLHLAEQPGGSENDPGDIIKQVRLGTESLRRKNRVRNWSPLRTGQKKQDDTKALQTFSEKIIDAELEESPVDRSVLAQKPRLRVAISPESSSSQVIAEMENDEAELEQEQHSPVQSSPVDFAAGKS